MVTGVQTCALPISPPSGFQSASREPQTVNVFFNAEGIVFGTKEQIAREIKLAIAAQERKDGLTL
jgi:hypothetical protein